MDIKARFGIIIPLFTATLIFIATALVGVWAAPNRSLAQLYFSVFLLGFALLAAIAFVLKQKAETVFGILGLICAALTAFFALHFVLTVNWAEDMTHRLSLMQQIGLWIHHHSLELSQLAHLQKNMVGTLLIVLLPFGLSGAIWAWFKRRRLVSVIAVITLLTGLLGLIMTSSRGAWLGFGLAVGYTVYFSWRFRPDRRFRTCWLADLLMMVFTLGIIASFPLSLKFSEFEVVSSLFLGNSTGRITLWRDSLPLIQDYPFTGSGLGNTAMVYSSYVFLLHVPFLSHAHNLYLQIAIEQGLPGLIVFAAMITFTILGLIEVYRYGNRLAQIYSAATFTALLAVLWHGLVEAELYAHLLRPIMFLPFGFTLILLLGNTQQQSAPRPTQAVRRANRFALVGSLAPLMVIASLFLWPGSLAALYSNMGAVAQTRAELAVFHWPEWPIQDELRRNDTVDLSVAAEYYSKALVLNPMNVTAHRRLGQIAISRRHFEAAQQHLEAAYTIAPDQRATRQMLGEIYGIHGDPESAIQLWRTINTANGQLDIRYWWYTYTGSEQETKWLRQAISQLNNTN